VAIVLGAPALLAVVLSVVGAAGRGPADAVVVGAGGEVFERDGQGGWRRRGGGVAAELLRAFGPSDGDVWAAGARPPLYHHDGKAWFAVPGTSGTNGAVVLAEAGSPLAGIAVGRRLFVLDGKRLAPSAAAPGPVTALWVGGARDIVIVVDGKVQRLLSSGWRPIPGSDERIVALGPRLAVGQDGGVYSLDARLRKIPADAGLAGFRPVRVAAGKRVLILGELGDGWTLATLAGGKVVALGTLPGVARADEPVALLPGEPILVATRSGLVLVGDGETWTTEHVDLAAPDEGARAPRPGAGPAPVGP
jgi:hypothetical protein